VTVTEGRKETAKEKKENLDVCAEKNRLRQGRPTPPRKVREGRPSREKTQIACLGKRTFVQRKRNERSHPKEKGNSGIKNTQRFRQIERKKTYQDSSLEESYREERKIVTLINEVEGEQRTSSGERGDTSSYLEGPATCGAEKESSHF